MKAISPLLPLFCGVVQNRNANELISNLRADFQTAIAVGMYCTQKQITFVVVRK